MILLTLLATLAAAQVPAEKGQRCGTRCQQTRAAGLIVFVTQLLQPCGEQPAALAAFMLRVNPKVAWDAQRLSCGIFREARRHRLDPAALAAVVWMESWFDLRADGSSGERGYWQLWPGGRKAMGWGHLTWRGAQRASMDVDRSTVAAVRIISTFVRWCRRQGGAHRDHRRPTDAYAHFNTGYRWPRPGYSRMLWHRTKLIRRVLNAKTARARAASEQQASALATNVK